jgi:hypothetical protein
MIEMLVILDVFLLQRNGSNGDRSHIFIHVLSLSKSIVVHRSPKLNEPSYMVIQ